MISQSIAARFFGRAGTIWVYLDQRAVETKAIHRYTDHVVFLKRIKQPIQHARIGPTAHSGIDRVPFAKPRRQGPPFAAIFGDKEDRVDDSKVRNTHIPALNRQVGPDQFVLFICYLNYNRYLTEK